MKIYLLIPFVLLGLSSNADVKPNTLFTNNGVLQQGVVVPVWGTASDGETVTVDFNGQHLSTTAKDGKWMVKLKPLKAGGPFSMIIKGNNTITISNILVGEVWLCSGQSNMGFPVRSLRAKGDNMSQAEVLKDAQNYPNIRQFAIPLKKWEATPPLAADANGKWLVCDSLNAKNFSAVAYFFGRALYRKLNVPIGLVNSSYGGTAGENWVSLEALQATPALKPLLDSYEKSLQKFPADLEKYKANEAQLLEKWKADTALAKLQNKKELPRKPTPPTSPAERGGPSGLYNTMIYPLIPYAIKGVVWYQGEANGSRGYQYRSILPALIGNWRTQWAIGDFPFLIVQIPGWKGHLPEIREAQLLTYQKTPNTSLTVITDVDDTLDVHPGNKQPVGERLSLAAFALAYHDKIEYEGPIYAGIQIQGNKIAISFTHTGSGLVAKNGELKDILIAGDDKKFVPAKADIQGDKIVVYSPDVAKPTAVRMGWRLCPQINLYNKEGLCATAFRTDVAP